MRVISWNMAGAGFHTARAHNDAWDWINSQEFDVALLQEAVPPSGVSMNYTSFLFRPYQLSRQFSWGNCIVSRNMNLAEFVPAYETDWMVDVARSTLVAYDANSDFYFANIHSSAQIVTNKKSQDLRSIGGITCHDEKLWDVEICAHFLQSEFSGKRFVFGGDLNSALLFDDVYSRSTNTRLFENLRLLGYHDLRLPHFVDEQQTYFKKGNREYQLDHLFGDSQTQKHTTTWQVLRDVAERELLSDHAPILIEIKDSKD